MDSKEKSNNSNIIRMKIIAITVVLILHYLATLASNIADLDLWGYLSFGRIFWEEHSFPYNDSFSYMPVKSPWIYHEWLTGVVLYPIFKYFGGAGLQGLRYVLAITALFLAYKIAKIRNAKKSSSILCLFLVAHVFAFGYSPVRAQAFTYLFFTLYLYLLEKSRIKQEWRTLAWLIPTQVLWCNLHGGYVAGLGLIIIYAVGEAVTRRKYLPYIAVLIPSALVTLINPYGLDYWTYTLNAVTMPRPDIAEWLNVISAIKQGLFQGAALSFFPLLLFVVLLYPLYHRRDLTTGLLLSVTAYLGFSHVRHIVFFGLVFAAYMPIIYDSLWDVLKNRFVYEERKKLAKVTVGIIIVVLSIDVTYTFYKNFVLGSPLSIQIASKKKSGVTEMHFPAGAVEYIKAAGFKGNILPFFDWGEYLIWNLYPECKVGMDGRYETVYPEKVHRAYFNFIYGRDQWRAFLNEYPHEMILIYSNTSIHNLLKKEDGWIEAYRGQGTSLFINKSYLSR